MVRDFLSHFQCDFILLINLVFYHPQTPFSFILQWKYTNLLLQSLETFAAQPPFTNEHIMLSFSGCLQLKGDVRLSALFLHFNARQNRLASWPSFYDATSLQNQASFMYHCPLCGPFPQEVIVRRAHISQPVGTRQVNSCRIRLRWESFSNCMWKKWLYRSIRGTRREIANVKWNVGADWSHFSICAVKCTAVIWLSGSCSRAHWQTETLRSVFMAAFH